MNKSKKIIKEQGLQTPDKKEQKAQEKSRKNLILIIIGAVIILGGVFVVCYTQLRPRAILTVEGPATNGETTKDTVNYTDAVYDIYQMESMYNSYGMDWDSDNGGSTLSSSVKKQIMDTLKQREVLCMQAEKDGTTLTDEEQKEVDTAVEEAMNAMPEESKGKKGLSESDVRASIEKQKLADKEKQHIIDGFDIDDEAIKNEINKGEYRQYTIQYYTITKMDEDANKASDGDEEKMKDEETLKKDKAEMEALQKRAKAGEDFEKLLTDSDGDQKDDTTGISYATKDLIETDADFADAQVRDQIKLMKNDEISGVIEGNEAYYVVKMINNDDPAAYDNEVKNRISTEENDQYTKYYDETVLPQYTITVQDYWSDRVNIGHITVPAK